MHAAVARECRAVRSGVGLLDASTLGKIDIQGPDAARFLDRVYTNAFLKLKVGTLPLWPDAATRTAWCSTTASPSRLGETIS